jgi:hypothetical protein
MKKDWSCTFIIAFIVQVFFIGVLQANSSEISSYWRVGFSNIIITPEQPMWMAGYAARNHDGNGTITNLWAKALYLEDNNKNKALLITSDLESFPKYLSDQIRDRIEKAFGLSRAQIILNSSHTHSGPLLAGMYNCYTEDSLEWKKAEEYSLKLEEKLIKLAGKAIKSVIPAKIYSGDGLTRFQVNRRNNSESKLSPITELKGPNDYSVPVMKIADSKGRILAVVFGYACHNTTLDGYQWCGDYAGFAQLELEKRYPGTTAMFFQGAGGDQNPLPRSRVTLARQYGRELASAVENVLEGEMHELSANLATIYNEIPLQLSDPPKEADLKQTVLKSSGYVKHWAEDLLVKIQKGQAIPTTYPYPVQLWKIGDLLVFSLGGEVVIEYDLKLKELFGKDIFVMGYCNDVMAYIPSEQILKEGGYEGETSMAAFGLPAPWKKNVQELIIEECTKLARQIKLLQNK